MLYYITKYYNKPKHFLLFLQNDRVLQKPIDTTKYYFIVKHDNDANCKLLAMQ